MIFDGPNRRIILEVGTTFIEAITIYSAWKDWVVSGAGAAFPEVFRSIGGDPLGGGVFAGSYFFLQTQFGWRIRPQEANHVLVVSGNLFADTSDPIFVPTLGAYNVQIIQSLSSLTQVVAGGGGGGLTPEQQAQLDVIQAAAEDARDYAATCGG